MAVPKTAITRFDLSAPFVEFMLAANRRKYIGPSVLRPRLVGVQAADVGKIPLEALLQQKSTKRASGAGYKRGDFEPDKYNYATDEYGWEEAMDDRTLAIYRDLFDAEEIHANRAINNVLEEYERDVAAKILNTAVWTGAALTTALSTKWSVKATATPIEDVEAARQKVINGSGLEPNALILNRNQYFNLINCDEIVERVKYTETATQEAMRRVVAQVLDLEHILVAGGITNSANPQQAKAISRIWPDAKASLARVAMTDDPQEPCVGRTFIWTEDGPGVPGDDSELAVLVEEYREEGIRGSVIRARNDRDMQIMYTSAAHLLTNVL